MSDKNLKASIELQVSTPGADKLAQLKKDIAGLVTELNKAGSGLTSGLDKTRSAATKAARDTSAAKETLARKDAKTVEASVRAEETANRKKLAAEKKHLAELDRARDAAAARERKRQADIQRMGRTQDRALKDDAKVNYTPIARDAKAARDLANAGAAYSREQAALARAQYQRDYVAHQQALAMNARIEQVTQAKLRAQQAALRREGQMLEQAHRMNAAFDARRAAQIQAAGVQQSQALAQNARRNAATQQAIFQRDYIDHAAALRMNAQITQQRAASAAAAQANTLGGRINSTMSSLGRSASDSFVNSFKSSLNSGMAAAFASAGAAIAARKIYQDNVDATAVKYGLQSAYGEDQDGGKSRGGEMEKRLFDLSNKYGVQYAGAAKSSIGFISAANASGMSDSDQMKVLNGLFATKTAMGLGEGAMQQAARAIGQMAGKQYVMSEELKLQLNDSIPGLYGAAISYITKNSGGVVKNGGDVDKLLAGQLKNKDGQTVRLESAKFLPAFMEWLSSKNGKAALEAANTGPAAGINKLTNTIFKLNEELGKAGAIAGFNRAMSGLADVVKDPQVVAAIKQIGANFKAFIDDMAPIATAVGNWVKQNTNLVVSLAGIGAKVAGVSVAMTVLLGIIGFIASPFVKLIGMVSFLTGGFFGLAGKTGLVMTGLKMLGAYMLGPLVTGFTGMRVAALSGAGGMAVFKTAADALLLSLGRIAGVAVIAGGALAAFSIGKGVSTQMSADKAMELNTVKASREDLMGASGALGKAIEGVDSAAGAGDIPPAKRAARKALLLARKQSIDGIIANQAKLEEAEAKKKMAAEQKAIEEKNKAELDKSTKEIQSLLTVGEVKGKKGRGANAQANDIKAAQADQDNRLEAMDLEVAKRTRQAREELLDQELQDGLRSYKSYYEEKQKLVTEQLDEEKKIALQARDDEIARIQKALKDGKPDAAAKEAAGIRIDTAEQEYNKKLLEIDQQRVREKSKLDQSETKDSEKYTKRLAELKAELDKLNGRVDLGAQNGAIDAEFAPAVKEAGANGDAERLALLQKLIAARKEVGRLAQLDEKFNISALEYGNRESEIQLALQQGLLTKAEAEDAVLALKKEQAAANLVLLEQEAALTQNPKVQAELQKQILTAKLVINTATGKQVELENTVEQSMSDAMQSVLNGSKSMLEIAKGFLQSIINSVNKMLSDELAGGVMKWMKGMNGGGEGGGIVGGFLNMLGMGASASRGAAPGFEYAGSGTGAASGGGFLATAASFIGSLFGFKEGGGISGAITGPGTSTSDSILARLSHGEYVLDAEDVKKMGGFQVLDNMREKLHAYKGGGGVAVAAKAAAAAGSAAASRALGGGTGPIINMTINTADANSFRASQSQIMGQMGAMSRMAQARNG
jgi:hypothetical protein